MHSIKDVLIFSSVTDDVAIFNFVFPWDTNPRNGNIVAMVSTDKYGTIYLGKWCQLIGNSHLGEQILYVDLPDRAAKVLLKRLREYNKIKNKLVAVRLYFDNGSVFVTSVNASSTDETIKKYFVGTRFVRQDEITFDTCVRIEIMR